MTEATVTVTVSYTTLETPLDMAQALVDALPRGYHGTITALLDEAAERWALVLNTPANAAQVVCRIGDVLMWDGNVFTSLDPAAFAERFGAGT